MLSKGVAELAISQAVTRPITQQLIWSFRTEDPRPDNRAFSAICMRDATPERNPPLPRERYAPVALLMICP